MNGPNYWVKIKRTVEPEGTTVTYSDLRETGLTIESRKRHIPHANRSGTWDHKSYWVLRDGEELVEKRSLTSAKEWANRYAIDRGLIHGPEE